MGSSRAAKSRDTFFGAAIVWSVWADGTRVVVVGDKEEEGQMRRDTRS